MESIQLVGLEIVIDLNPVFSWLERRRPPDKAALVRQRLDHLLCEAIRCAGLDIPEFAGGTAAPGTGDVTPGAHAAGALLSHAMTVAAYLVDWANDIEAEDNADKSGGPSPPRREVPRWDGTARLLRFRGEECKRFRKPARDQEKVLAAFQEEGWPDAIDDPLPSGKLARTVESLNDRLRHIKFSLNGTGTGVCWHAA
jgi:hypothetical protein